MCLYNLLPNLLNIELCHIDFAQTFGFAFLFNFVFGIPKSEDKKSNNDDKNGDNTIKLNLLKTSLKISN